jgi:hypothetical protein
MQLLKTKKRLEKLEQAYYPQPKRYRGLFSVDLPELMFMHAYNVKYGGCEESAPAILRGAYEDLQNRWRKAKLERIEDGIEKEDVPPR